MILIEVISYLNIVTVMLNMVINMMLLLEVRLKSVEDLMLGRSGSLAITIVADWKARYSDGDFIDQDLGHTLDFLRVLMTHIQPFRIFVYGILSDGILFDSNFLNVHVSKGN